MQIKSRYLNQKSLNKKTQNLNEVIGIVNQQNM